MLADPILATEVRLLQQRLSALRWRMVVHRLLQGGVLTTIFLIGTILAVVGLDIHYQLPSYVRALALVSIFGIGWVLLRWWVVQPLLHPPTRLQVALRLEREYPELEESLVSAVQFAQRPTDPGGESESLRQRTIERAVAVSQSLDFPRILKRRWTLAAVGMGLVFLAVLFQLPRPSAAVAQAAAWRLLDPFGGHMFPKQTQIEIQSPQVFPYRLARGEAFRLRLTLRGVIPPRYWIDLWPQGASTALAIPRPTPEVPPEATELTFDLFDLDPERLLQPFRFRLRANDAETTWYEVQVVAAPTLVPLDGRASPQMTLHYPSYTGKPRERLDDGATLTEAVAGTRIELRAKTDRPIARAWLDYHPEKPIQRWTPALTLLMARDARTLGGLWALSREVWAPIPVTLADDQRTLHADFVPRLRGTYALRLDDGTGIVGTRLFDLRIFPDPAPEVRLDWPSPLHDGLLFLPDAALTLATGADDGKYGLARVGLEYRFSRQDTPQALVLAEFGTPLAVHAPADAIALLAGSAIVYGSRPIQHWAEQRRLPLSRLVKANGQPPREGEVLFLRAYAEDFDTVTGFKAPGRSTEIEIQIVGRSSVEALLDRSAAALRYELQRLHAQQAEVRKQLAALAAAKAPASRLSERQELLQRIEQTQSEIRGRLTSPTDGLLAELERQQQMLRENALPKSSSSERLDLLQRELERLAREELPAVETWLGLAREAISNESAKDLPWATLQAHQQEVERTLQGLIDRLEPWSVTGELRGEARQLQHDQDRLRERTERLARQLLQRKASDGLRAEERKELDRLATQQERLADRGRQWIDKLERMLAEREREQPTKLAQVDALRQEAAQRRTQAAQLPADSTDRLLLQQQADEREAQADRLERTLSALQAELDTLRRVREAGQTEALKNHLRNAGQRLKLPANRPNDLPALGEASEAQRSTSEQLERLVEAFAPPATPPPSVDRLRKNRQRLLDRVDTLAEAQERLRKQIAQANALTDPQQRQRQLDALALQQHQLDQATRQLAREADAEDDPFTAETLRRAADDMRDAARDLESGTADPQKQHRILDRLDEAQERAETLPADSPDTLQREPTRQLLQQLDTLRRKVQSTIDESRRVDAIIRKAKFWDRAEVVRFSDLIDRHEQLSEELRNFSSQRLADAPVFARRLEQAAAALDAASQRIAERKEDALTALESAQAQPIDQELEKLGQNATAAQHQRALTLIDQLLKGLREATAPASPPRASPKVPPEADSPTTPNAPARTDRVPLSAQWQLLRDWQAEVRSKTIEFQTKYPDRAQWTEEQARQWDALRAEQAGIAELLRKVLPNTDLPPEK